MVRREERETEKGEEWSFCRGDRARDQVDGVNRLGQYEVCDVKVMRG